MHGGGVAQVHRCEPGAVDRHFGRSAGTDHDLGSRPHEGARDSGADTARAPGDDDELSPQPPAVLLPGSLSGVIHRLSRGLPFAATFDIDRT
ncbi:hypothetical protein GCM10023083_54580 [Streptomyces phyllanthi]